MLNIFFLGQLVHTAGAALLAAIFLYLSRGKGNRALNAAGVAWLFLALSLASLLLLSGRGLPFENFLYLSRGKGNRALNAAGVAWMFLALSLASLLLLSGRGLPFENFLYQYWKILFIVALITAARRMDHQNPLARPLALTAGPSGCGSATSAP